MFYGGLNGDDCRDCSDEYDGDVNNFAGNNYRNNRLYSSYSRKTVTPIDFQSLGLQYTGRETEKAFLLECSVENIPIKVTFWVPKRWVNIQSLRFKDFTYVCLAKENMLRQIRYLDYGHLILTPFEGLRANSAKLRRIHNLL